MEYEEREFKRVIRDQEKELHKLYKVIYLKFGSEGISKVLKVVDALKQDCFYVQPSELIDKLPNNKDLSKDYMEQNEFDFNVLEYSYTQWEDSFNGEAFVELAENKWVSIVFGG